MPDPNTPSKPASMLPSKSALAPVLLVNFIGTMGFGIVLPFLVFLVTRFGGNPLIYGVVGAAYPVFQFFGAPVLGRWSDRFGRERILLLSQAGTFLSWVIFCVALTLPVTTLLAVDSALLGKFTLTLPLVVIFIARALDGLTGGNISVANAYVADISTDETRNANFGKMGAAANLGYILGPAMASLLGMTSYGEILPVLAATAISLVALVMIATILPESNICGVPAPGSASRAGGVLGQEPRDCMRTVEGGGGNTREALRLPGVAFILFLNFLILLSFNFFYTAFPVHAVTNLRWTIVETGIFFSLLSFLMVIMEGPVLSWLSKRIEESWLVVAGCFLLGATFLFMQSFQVAWVYLGAVFFALGNGIMWPSLVSLVAHFGGARHQGVVQGMAGSAGSLAGVIGLVSGGIAFGVMGAGTFLISAGFAYASFALAFLLPGMERKVREAA